MSSKLLLEITRGAGQGKQIVFDEHDTFLVGRMEDCDLCLAGDPKVSRHHFLLEVNPPDARLRDLGSMNGTYVNGRKYGGRERSESPRQGARRRHPDVDLEDGDEIRVGGLKLRLGVELAAECAECGTPIPEAARERDAWVGGGYLCPACRKKLAAAGDGGSDDVRPAVVRCRQCGRPVGSAAGRRPVCATCRRQAEDDPAELLLALLGVGGTEPPQLDIPGYEILRELGRGGMGAVYLARHKERGDRVALKVMLSKVAVSPPARERFLQEVEITRGLKHPNVVKFLGHGEAGDCFYFLLELCEGGSVDTLMTSRGGRLSLDEARPIVLQALAGLAYAHEEGFVHRDLKPQNILLAGDERNRSAKIADLGLAKSFIHAGLSGMTATGSFAGSFPFMPREQLIQFRHSRPVSDVWAMGATFYNMLTGQVPRDFRLGQDPIETILRGEIVPLRKRDPSLAGPVVDVIDRALAAEPSDRYQDAGEMLKAVERASPDP